MANTIIMKEMLANFIEQKLGDAIKLYPLAKVENVDAEAGDTIRIPKTAYIGDAATIEAGVAIPLENITQTSESVKVAKAAKGLVFTVEDINNAYMDVQAEAEKQMLKAIANKVEKDLFTELAKASQTANIATLDVDGLAEAVVPFGEDLEEEMYLFVNPADLAVLRKDDSFIVNANHGEGKVKSAGQIFGMEVVVTNRVEANTAYIVKEGAVALYLKQAVLVEEEKDIVKQVYNIVATQHYAVALNDITKAIKVTIAGA